MLQKVPASFETRRVTGTLGAEISGVDLCAPMDDATVAALTDALVEHKVLFFRDQPLTTEQHLAFGRRFGTLEVHPFTEAAPGYFGNLPGFEQVLVLESTAERPVVASNWHSDVTWRVDPSLGSILHCVVAPEFGGDTVWADMAAAHDGLDDATQRQLSSLVAVHDWHGFRKGMRRSGVPEDRIGALEKEYPPVEHPLVRTHPVSKRKVIYVNSPFTVRIKGMGETESNALLERLFRLAAVPEYQVRFSWKKNSVAFWDNRSTQHYGVPDFFPQHRRMERVTIVGDRPF